jgi:hypothetical protein
MGQGEDVGLMDTKYFFRRLEWLRVKRWDDIVKSKIVKVVSAKDSLYFLFGDGNWANVGPQLDTDGYTNLFVDDGSVWSNDITPLHELGVVTDEEMAAWCEHSANEIAHRREQERESRLCDFRRLLNQYPEFVNEVLRRVEA